MARLLIAAALALALPGCAPWLERPFAGLRDHVDPTEELVLSPFGRPVPCGSGFSPTPGYRRRHGTIVIGSVVFADLRTELPPSRFAPGSPPITALMVVPPRSRVIVSVPVDQRDVAGVDPAPRPFAAPDTSHRAVRCVTGDELRAFRIAFVVEGARCLPISVTIDRVTTTREVGFGVRDCP